MIVVYDSHIAMRNVIQTGRIIDRAKRHYSTYSGLVHFLESAIGYHSVKENAGLAKYVG